MAPFPDVKAIPLPDPFCPSPSKVSSEGLIEGFWERPIVYIGMPAAAAAVAWAMAAEAAEAAPPGTLGTPSVKRIIALRAAGRALAPDSSVIASFKASDISVIPVG